MTEQYNNSTVTFDTVPTLVKGSSVVISGNTLIVTGTFYNNVGLYPSIPSKPEAFTNFVYSDPHTWLTSLRDYTLMLRGDLKIPHLPRLSGNRSRRRKQLREARNKPKLDRGRYIQCSVCVDALEKRREYRNATICSR